MPFFSLNNGCFKQGAFDTLHTCDVSGYGIALSSHAQSFFLFMVAD